ncbi:Hypothetical protein D9617_24g016810 [Elsinoe fawcettii]|nr:Hypothetical protein D9617_24g016810 [Elsinoe fawcettii]
MVGLRQAALLRSDTDEHGRKLSAEERERLIKPYLPAGPVASKGRSRSRSSQSHGRKKPIRTFLKTALYVSVFNLMQWFFSIFYRIRRAYRNMVSRSMDVMYHHHRTPELIQKDVKGFKKMPKHLSIALDLDGRTDDAALENLINEACECAAWTACAGIPTLSIYESTGILKSSLPHLHRQISNTIASYYGVDNSARPSVSLRAPQVPAFSPPTASPDPSAGSPPHLSILLLSETDGRRTLVDLTKTLAEMSQKHKLAPEDISTELIDAELSESVMGEPDLLILFGESVVLDGYPPWQVRLSEIFNTPTSKYQIDIQEEEEDMYPYDDAVPTVSSVIKNKYYTDYDQLHLKEANSSRKLTLDDLPTEILCKIAGFLCDKSDSTVYVKRRAGTSFTQSDLTSGVARKCWTVSGYPLALLQVNRTLHAAVARQLWYQTVFVLSLSSSDTLIFLKYALSAAQRAALQRIRLTRFMLSWEDGVGDDIWLAAHRREPAFHARIESKRHAKRVENLVDHLQSRHLAIA